MLPPLYRNVEDRRESDVIAKYISSTYHSVYNDSSRARNSYPMRWRVRGKNNVSYVDLHM